MISFGQINKTQLRDHVTPHKIALHVVVQEVWSWVMSQGTVITDVDNVYSEQEERDLLFTLLQLVQVGQIWQQYLA